MITPAQVTKSLEHTNQKQKPLTPDPAQWQHALQAASAPAAAKPVLPNQVVVAEKPSLTPLPQPDIPPPDIHPASLPALPSLTPPVAQKKPAPLAAASPLIVPPAAPAPLPALIAAPPAPMPSTPRPGIAPSATTTATLPQISSAISLLNASPPVTPATTPEAPLHTMPSSTPQEPLPQLALPVPAADSQTAPSVSKKSPLTQENLAISTTISAPAPMLVSVNPSPLSPTGAAPGPAPALPDKSRFDAASVTTLAATPTTTAAAPLSPPPPLASATAPLITPDSANLAAAITAMHQSGQASATLRLDPPGLGNLTIHLGLGQENAVNVQFITAVPQTTQIIANHLNDLRQAMENAGIALGNTQIGGGNAGQHPGGNPNGNPTSPPAISGTPGPAQSIATMQPGIRAVA